MYIHCPPGLTPLELRGSCPEAEGCMAAGGAEAGGKPTDSNWAGGPD